MKHSQLIKKRAKEIGLDAYGICRAVIPENSKTMLKDWLGKDYYAGMDYMARNLDKRLDPSLLVEGAKTAVVCLISYKQPETVSRQAPRIAEYALGTDYHYTLKAMLNSLWEYMTELFPESSGRAFTDSAPLAERSLAVQAGLGWIGQNSMLINPELGSYTLIGTILTDAETDEYDAPYLGDHCGKCGKCVRACPTGAINPDRTVNANLCLSYHTIENRGQIPDEIAAHLTEWMFGCDICQQVCPHNKKAHAKPHPVFTITDNIDKITPEEWLAMGRGEFTRRFGSTPLSRAGLKKIKQIIRLVQGVK